LKVLLLNPRSSRTFTAALLPPLLKVNIFRIAQEKVS